MRISDWSSDVCSSDLGRGQFGGGAVRPQAHAVDGLALDHGRLDACVQAEQGDPRLDRLGVAGSAEGAGLEDVAGLVVLAGRDGRRRRRRFGGSEEHTSELQSLMRISYAVFCLKKQTHQNTIN